MAWRRHRIRKRKLPRVIRRLQLQAGGDRGAIMVLRAQQRVLKTGAAERRPSRQTN